MVLGLLGLGQACGGVSQPEARGGGRSITEPGDRTPAQWLATQLGRQQIGYARPENWVCHPEFGGICDEANLDAAVHLTDGTTIEVAFRPATNPAVDCFYIYPTVDLSLLVGNHDDLRFVGSVPEVVLAQAGRWRAACRVFAPLYRQVRLGTYVGFDAERVVYFERAFLDVATAFETYLRLWNDGRPIVVLGHSQGAQMASYLLHVYFDGDRSLGDLPARTSDLRRRLVAAYPIGFYVYVPSNGNATGGSFADLPVCTAPDLYGCVVHYRSYVEGFPPRSAGVGYRVSALMAERGYLHVPPSDTSEIVCVNPARGMLGSGDRVEDGTGRTVATSTATRVPIGTLIRGIETPREQPFAGYPGRYAATCRRDERGGSYLAFGLRVPPGGDVREDPIGIGGELARGVLGLHLWDYALLLDDLVIDLEQRLLAFLSRRGA